MNLRSLVKCSPSRSIADRNQVLSKKLSDSSQLKEFADDNLKFDEKLKIEECSRKHCGKRRNCSLRAISPFPTVVLQTCKNQGLLKETGQRTSNKGPIKGPNKVVFVIY